MVRATTKFSRILVISVALSLPCWANDDHGHATTHGNEHATSHESAHAAPTKHESTARQPASTDSVCGLIEKWDGPVQVLDSTRTKLIDLKLGAPLPCGAWISTGQGRISIRHSQGFQARIAARSFVELKPTPVEKDAVTLYQGALLLAPNQGAEEIQIMTANSRARVSSGASIVIYNQKEQNTQLISLDGSASLENRFENSRRVDVHAGESTQLNLSLLRVIPSLARAVASTSLKPLMTEFAVTEKDQVQFIGKMQHRVNRQWAAILKTYDGSSSDRMPASEYSRHPVKGPKVEVKWEDVEKKRLMNELSTIPKNE